MVGRNTTRRGTTPPSASTPVRDALRPESSLQGRVEDGLGALAAEHRDLLELAVRREFADSLDLDEALRPGHDREHRWDYLLGHAPSNSVVALEPHPARQDEIGALIAKRRRALDQLRPHLREGAKIRDWLWVASGRVCFASTEKVARQLDQHGIRFVGRTLLAKHLPRPFPEPR